MPPRAFYFTVAGLVSMTCCCRLDAERLQLRPGGVGLLSLGDTVEEGVVKRQALESNTPEVKACTATPTCVS